MFSSMSANDVLVISVDALSDCMETQFRSFEYIISIMLLVEGHINNYEFDFDVEVSFGRT